MQKWHTYGAVVGTKYLGIVEAETKEEAIEKGAELESAYVSLCHHCSRECETPEIESVDAEEIEE